jgi:hypothetical protein
LWVFAGEGNWKSSLEGLGTCGHSGNIPKRAITGISLFDPREEPNVALYILDGRVGLMNKAISGKAFMAITRWFMGYEVDPSDLCGWKMEAIIPALEAARFPEATDPDQALINEVAIPDGLVAMYAHMKQMYDGWERVIKARKGLRVIRP